MSESEFYPQPTIAYCLYEIWNDYKVSGSFPDGQVWVLLVSGWPPGCIPYVHCAHTPCTEWVLPMFRASFVSMYRSIAYLVYPCTVPRVSCVSIYPYVPHVPVYEGAPAVHPGYPGYLAWAAEIKWSVRPGLVQGPPHGVTQATSGLGPKLKIHVTLSLFTALVGLCSYSEHLKRFSHHFQSSGLIALISISEELVLGPKPFFKTQNDVFAIDFVSKSLLWCQILAVHLSEV